MSSTKKYSATGLVSNLLHSRPTAEGKRATICNKHEDNKLNRKVKLLEKRRKEKLHIMDIRRQHFERDHEEHLPPLISVSSPLTGRHKHGSPKITCNGRELLKPHDFRASTSLPDITESIRTHKERVKQEAEVTRLRTRSCESLKISKPAKDSFFISDLFHLTPPQWDYEKLPDKRNNNGNDNNVKIKRHDELEPIHSGKTRINPATRARSLSHEGINLPEMDLFSKQRSMSTEIPRHTFSISHIKMRKKSL